MNYFLNDGWDVYQEVRYHQRSCDVVAQKGRLLWAVECKAGGFLAALEQARGWVHVAHFVSIAMPAPSARSGTTEEIMRHFGIGFLGFRHGGVFRIAGPRLNRRLWEPFSAGWLNERQKTYAPAGAQSGRWTPFRETCEDLKRFVDHHPGCSMKEAIAGIEHHYSSDIVARTALCSWIKEGKVPGVSIKRNGRYINLYAADRGKEER